jgi:hypothetical protein
MNLLFCSIKAGRELRGTGYAMVIKRDKAVDV